MVLKVRKIFLVVERWRKNDMKMDFNHINIVHEQRLSTEKYGVGSSFSLK